MFLMGHSQDAFKCKKTEDEATEWNKIKCNMWLSTEDVFNFTCKQSWTNF